MKILVVEDDRKVRGFIEQGLREEGYAVDVAPDGQEGTTLAHVYEYDLLVLDVMLPKKNGLQVAQELRPELLEKVWDLHFDPESNVVDIDVGNQRRKLKDASDLELIHTVRGVGFRFQSPDREDE